jgi:hypothetical protein
MEEANKVIICSEESKYKEETDAFSLSVILNESKVLFTLKDYKDWILYGKTFTK